VSSLPSWTIQEEIRLMQMFGDQEPVKRIAASLGRSPKSVSLKLERLGFIVEAEKKKVVRQDRLRRQQTINFQAGNR